MPDFSKFWKIIIFVVVFIIAFYVAESFNHKKHEHGTNENVESDRDW